jgi:hypothetical protein
MRAMMLVLFAMAVAVFGMGDAGAGEDTASITLQLGQRQLFLDDYVVGDASGLTRTMHSPEKRGAVIRPDIPTDGPLIQTRCEPVWSPDDAEYKMIYYAYCGVELGTCMALATSKDGINWKKPSLGLVDALGNVNNNLIAIDPNVRPPNRAIDGLAYDAEDKDPARRYKTLMGAIVRFPAVSPDCVHWTRLGEVEIPSSDESHFLYDQERRKFHAIVKTSNAYGRAFAISSSDDFEHWSPNRPLFSADDEDQVRAPEVISRRLANPNMVGLVYVEPKPEKGAPLAAGHQAIWRAEVYNIAVFPYEGMYIGLPSIYYPTGTSLPARNNTDGFHEIQLAMSRDLQHWDRLGERKPFIETSGIEHGRVGVYDRTQILAANRPIVRDGEILFYYSGLKWRDPIYELNPDGTPRASETLTDDERADIKDGWGAICMASLRRDGFISLDAADGGELITKPLQFAGKALFLNLSASQGQATVEIVDLDGAPISGFAQGDANPITGDAVRQPVSWKNGTNISALAGKTARLKIHLKSAELYAFWTE